MKQIYIDGEPTYYYIFEDGRLLSKKTKTPIELLLLRFYISNKFKPTVILV